MPSLYCVNLQSCVRVSYLTCIIQLLHVCIICNNSLRLSRSLSLFFLFLLLITHSCIVFFVNNILIFSSAFSLCFLFSWWGLRVFTIGTEKKREKQLKPSPTILLISYLHFSVKVVVNFKSIFWNLVVINHGLQKLFFLLHMIGPCRNSHHTLDVAFIRLEVQEVRFFIIIHSWLSPFNGNSQSSWSYGPLCN